MTKPRTRSHTRTNDPTGLRDRVLDVAAHEFQLHGYGATSTHALVRAARTTGGALHHHFPTKRQIALAVITERVSVEIGDSWVAAVRQAPTAAHGIVAAADAIIVSLDANGSVSGCPLGNLALELALADEGLRAALAGEYAKWRDAIAARVDADLACGRARYAEGDAQGFANVVVAMFSGALGIAKTEQGTASLHACRARLAAWMAPDLEAGPA